MKDRNRLVSGLIGINILLIVIVLNTINKTNKLASKSNRLEYEVNEYKETILELGDFKHIKEKINSLEKENNLELLQRIIDTENKIDRIQDLILRQDNINIIYGTIKEIEENDNITLKIKAYDQKKKQYSSELQSLQVSNDCKPYFYSEIGLVQASIEDLIEKIRIEANENFEDNYTFIVIEDKVVQIYQGYSK